MRKTVVVMFCLLGILLFSGCKEQPVEEVDIPEPEEPIIEEEPVEEINETIEINETVEEVNETVEEEIIYTEEEINLCKDSALGDFNITEEFDMEKYNNLVKSVREEQITKEPIIKNLNRDIYTEETLETFDRYLTCLNYKIE